MEAGGGGPCASGVRLASGTEGAGCEESSVITVTRLLASLCVWTAIGTIMLALYARLVEQKTAYVNRDVTLSQPRRPRASTATRRRPAPAAHRRSAATAAEDALGFAGWLAGRRPAIDLIRTVGLDGGLYLNMLWLSAGFFYPRAVLPFGAIRHWRGCGGLCSDMQC